VVVDVRKRSGDDEAGGMTLSGFHSRISVFWLGRGIVAAVVVAVVAFVVFFFCSAIRDMIRIEVV